MRRLRGLCPFLLGTFTFAYSLPCCLPTLYQVALAEQELYAMGKQIHQQEKLEAVSESKPPRRPKAVRQRRSFGGKDRKKSDSSASGKPTKPLRHSLDNVGDHEVKVQSRCEIKVHEVKVNIVSEVEVRVVH